MRVEHHDGLLPGVDYLTSGIDYLEGKLRDVGGTHRVLSTEDELYKWTRA